MVLLVTGASGRLGRLLRTVWGDTPPLPGGTVWQGRSPTRAGDLCWDFGADLPANWPQGAVILHLAGVTRGTPEQLHANVTLARALAAAARAGRAAHVLLASTVAVWPVQQTPLAEHQPPAPANPYGASKLAAEQALRDGLRGSGIGLTALRIGNVAGADALLGGALARPGQAVTLDPVPGQPAGPERSYIGPLTLARVLAALIQRAPNLPDVLNLAQPGPIAMGDLLQAARADWQFGPLRDGVAPRVVMDTAQLQSLVTLEQARPVGLVAELDSLRGRWP